MSVCSQGVRSKVTRGRSKGVLLSCLGSVWPTPPFSKCYKVLVFQPICMTDDTGLCGKGLCSSVQRLHCQVGAYIVCSCQFVRSTWPTVIFPSINSKLVQNPSICCLSVHFQQGADLLWFQMAADWCLAVFAFQYLEYFVHWHKLSEVF